MELLPNISQNINRSLSIVKFIFKHLQILPNSDGYHSNHFRHDNPDMIPFEDNRWDSLGNYYEGDLNEIPHRQPTLPGMEVYPLDHPHYVYTGEPTQEVNMKAVIAEAHYGEQLDRLNAIKDEVDGITDGIEP